MQVYELIEHVLANIIPVIIYNSTSNFFYTFIFLNNLNIEWLADSFTLAHKKLRNDKPFAK